MAIFAEVTENACINEINACHRW